MVFSEQQLGVLPWEDFEKYVKDVCSSYGEKVLNFEVSGKKMIDGVDGEYEIDASVTFELFGGAKYLTLIECKSYKQGNNVSRDLVMVLNQKLQSIGAQKGIMFTTSDFQSGAIKFAKKHRIALVQMCDGGMNYITKGFYSQNGVIQPSELELFGYLVATNEKGEISYSMVSEDIKDELFGGAK